LNVNLLATPCDAGLTATDFETEFVGETEGDTTAADTVPEEIVAEGIVAEEIVLAIIAKFVSVGGLHVFRTTNTIALPRDTSGQSRSEKHPNWKNS
jgi:hypothetical protein